MEHRNAMGKWLSEDDEGKTKKEEKIELGEMVDDRSAGNIASAMRMIHPGVASSTIHWTATIPPVIPVGGATNAPTPALIVGGMGGHMKLEPPSKFTGKGFPTVWA